MNHSSNPRHDKNKITEQLAAMFASKHQPRPIAGPATAKHYKQPTRHLVILFVSCLLIIFSVVGILVYVSKRSNQTGTPSEQLVRDNVRRVTALRTDLQGITMTIDAEVPTLKSIESHRSFLLSAQVICQDTTHANDTYKDTSGINEGIRSHTDQTAKICSDLLSLIGYAHLQTNALMHLYELNTKPQQWYQPFYKPLAIPDIQNTVARSHDNIVSIKNDVEYTGHKEIMILSDNLHLSSVHSADSHLLLKKVSETRTYLVSQQQYYWQSFVRTSDLDKALAIQLRQHCEDAQPLRLKLADCRD